MTIQGLHHTDYQRTWVSVRILKKKINFQNYQRFYPITQKLTFNKLLYLCLRK